MAGAGHRLGQKRDKMRGFVPGNQGVELETKRYSEAHWPDGLLERRFSITRPALRRSAIRLWTAAPMPVGVMTWASRGIGCQVSGLACRNSMSLAFWVPGCGVARNSSSAWVAIKRGRLSLRMPLEYPEMLLRRAFESAAR